MELLTEELFEQLLENGRQSAAAREKGEDEPDHLPVVKLFNPVGPGTWLLSEIYPSDHDIAFGLADIGMDCAELGDVSLEELRSIKGWGGLGIERDKYITFTHPLSVYTRAGSRARHIVTDPNSLEAVLQPSD